MTHLKFGSYKPHIQVPYFQLNVTFSLSLAKHSFFLVIVKGRCLEAFDLLDQIHL